MMRFPDFHRKAGSLIREELVPGGCGHGCGHNLLGAGAMAAAIGIRAYLEAEQNAGYGHTSMAVREKKAERRRRLWQGMVCGVSWMQR